MTLKTIKLPTGADVSVEDTPENVEAVMQFCAQYVKVHSTSLQLAADVDQMLATLPLVKKLSDADLSSIAQFQPVSDMLGPGSAQEANR